MGGRTGNEKALSGCPLLREKETVRGARLRAPEHCDPI